MAAASAGKRDAVQRKDPHLEDQSHKQRTLSTLHALFRAEEQAAIAELMKSVEARGTVSLSVFLQYAQRNFDAAAKVLVATVTGPESADDISKELEKLLRRMLKTFRPWFLTVDGITPKIVAQEVQARLMIRLAEWKSKAFQLALHRQSNLEAGRVRKPSVQLSREEADPYFTHSDDYRGIRFNGQSHTLTRNQAVIIKILHEAFQHGTPDVGSTKLLAALENETGRVRDSFKGSLLWQALVVSGERKGTYRLNLPPHK